MSEFVSTRGWHYVARERLSPFSQRKRLSDDLDAVDLKQRHCGVAADLGVVVHLPSTVTEARKTSSSN
jgi:hypothetical protein